MKKLISLCLAFMLTLSALTIDVATVYAHQGRTDANGGHYVTTTGEYHYHNDKTTILISPAGVSESVKGKNIGNYYGVVDGYAIGQKNYQSKLTSRTYTYQYNTDFSTRTKSSEYKSQTNEYKEAFEKSYLEGYKLGYSYGINGQTQSADDLALLAGGSLVVDTTQASGTSSGQNLGQAAGKTQAEIDFSLGITALAEKSFKDFTSSESLNSRYNLNKLDDEYETDFEVAFEENYISSYTSTYIGLMDGLNQPNFNYTRINNVESDFDFVLNTDSSSQAAHINFPVGSVYGFGYIGGRRYIRPVEYNPKILKFVNYDFEIKTFNTNNYSRSEFIEANNPFTLSIDHNTSSDNVGIYEFKNGAWQYILTDVQVDKVSHTFPVGLYKGGRYCIFVEPNYPKFDDTYFSPFYDEIYTYARRRAIYVPTTKFNPTSNITRGEFAFMINGIMNPNNAVATDKSFIDITKTSPYLNSANYVAQKGYINGVSNNQFGVNSPLTYNQLKIIIERITGEPFNMTYVFNSMQNDKFHKSKGVSNMNANVTREEAVYILYQALN